jgi:hypothetical protein
MNLSELVQYTTLGTALAAIFSVAFAVVSHRREINASIYLDLSDRLHRLLQSLPVEFRSANITGKHPDSVSDRGLVVVVDFLHLMGSAHTLYISGYFSGRLWKQLRSQAERGLQLPVFRTIWPQIRGEFLASPDFVAFVEKCQTAASRGGR